MNASVPASLSAFLSRALSELPGQRFALRLTDGQLLSGGAGQPAFTLVLRELGGLARVLAAPSWRTLGEAYLHDDIDIEGDIEAVYPVAELLLDHPFDLADLEAGAHELDMPPFSESADPHSPDRDAAAIEYHYDQSNSVFEKITDRTFNYSSGYYNDPGDSLEQAQTAKMHRVCRKAGLRDGDRVLDIGCGWGGLLSHVGGHYGGALTGVTISKAQAEYTRARMQREGLGERVEIIVQDYREISERVPWDKVLSVGMVEHVGVEQLQVYFDKAARLLRPGGLFVLQGVSSSVSEATTKAIDFTNAYVFPDADMPYLCQYLDAAQRAGFEVRDVENLREHYAWTHRAWRANLERHREAIVDELGLARYRALRLLFSYATHYMLAGKASVYQFVLWKPDGDRPRALPTKREL